MEETWTFSLILIGSWFRQLWSQQSASRSAEGEGSEEPKGYGTQHGTFGENESSALGSEPDQGFKQKISDSFDSLLY